MEFSRQEEKVMQDAAAISNDDSVIQLSDLQLLAVGGGVADVNLS